MKYNLLVLAPVRGLQPAWAGTSAWAWQDQCTLHPYHSLELAPVTSGHKIMTERGQELWLWGKEGSRNSTRGGQVVHKGQKMEKCLLLGFLFVSFSFLFAFVRSLYEGRELCGPLKAVSLRMFLLN